MAIPPEFRRVRSSLDIDKFLMYCIKSQKYIIESQHAYVTINPTYPQIVLILLGRETPTPCIDFFIYIHAKTCFLLTVLCKMECIPWIYFHAKFWGIFSLCLQNELGTLTRREEVILNYSIIKCDFTQWSKKAIIRELGFVKLLLVIKCQALLDIILFELFSKSVRNFK